MRESSKSGLTMVIFAIIMVVFAFSFGAPMDGCQARSGPKYIATVNGYDIETDELGIIFNRWGGRRNQDAAQLATERAKALKAAILIHLLADEAKKMGLAVSDEELKEYLLNPTRNAEFQAIYGRRGKLDKTYMKNYIENQLRVSLKRYDRFKKTELLARKYIELVEMQLAATPVEIKQLDELRNTKVKLDYIKLNAKLIQSNVQLTDAEIDAFIQSDKKAVEAQYNKDKPKKYVKPAKYQLRRIYISVPANDEAKKKAAIAKFEDAKKRVNEKKEDFGKVAKALGDDFFGKNKDGLMDWAPKEYLPEEINKEIDKMKKGEVKETKTKTSLILYKFEDKKEGEVTPLEKVQKDIAKTLLKEKKAKSVVDKMVKRLETKVKASKTLKEALDAIKAEEKAKHATKTEEEKQPAPTNKPADKAADKKPAPAKPKSPWDAVKVATTPFFTLEGQDMSSFFGGRLPPGVTLGRGPWDQIPGIGKSKEITLAAFAMTADKPKSDKIYTIGADKVFIQLAERQDPNTPAKKDPKKKDDKKADKKDDAKDKASKQMALAAEIRSDRSNALIKGWQTLFLVPQDSYGPWLEDLYKSAYKNKKLNFSKRHKAAIQLQNKFDPILGDAKDKGKTDKKATKGAKPKVESKKVTKPAKKK